MASPDDEPIPAPPRLAAGSPAAPPGQDRPRLGDSVFVDTSAAFERNYRLPLIVCARLEFLSVCWSPYVAGEIARVATREAALTTLRHLTAGQNEAARVSEALQEVRRTVDGVLALLERSWSCPQPDRLRQSSSALAGTALADANDRPVLAAAIATETTFLLSRDRESFPHGGNSGEIAFWHPDTFLTALFEDNPNEYQDVLEELHLLPAEATLFPRH